MPPSTPIEMPERFDVPGDVAGSRVLITGAGRGLGSVLASAFSLAGARVALVSRTTEELHEIADGLPNETLVLAADVSDPLANEAVCEQIERSWGGLDVAILNAGISPSLDDPLSLSVEVWRRIIDVNLSGVFFGARAAARVMHDGGRIIATGSVLVRAAEGRSRRLRHVEGRRHRARQGARGGSGAEVDHGQRGCAGLVRVAAGRGVDGQRRTEPKHPRPHGRSAVGQPARISPGPTCSSPPHRRTTSPDP